MYGSLTQKGGEAHEGITRRMHGRFPQIFSDNDRRIINCTSSTVPRCLVSMNFFSSELTKLAPKEEFHFYCSDKAMTFIAHDIDMENMHKVNERASDSIRALRFNPERMMHLLFTDTDKATTFMKGNVQRFFKSVYLAGSIAQDMDAPYDRIDIYKFFNTEELYIQWWAYNARMYENHCNSKEYGDYRAKTAANLLRHITEEADSAIEGGNTAADFCFGHDTGLLPLINLIKMKGQDEYYSLEDASDHWFGFEAGPIQQACEQIGFFGFSSVRCAHDGIGRAEAIAGLIQCQPVVGNVVGRVFEDSFQFVFVLFFPFGQALSQSRELWIAGRIELFE